MVSSGMLRRVALVRTDVSEEPSTSFRVTRIGELGTTIAITSNLTMKNYVSCDIKPQSVPHRRHIASPLQSPAGLCYVRFEVFTEMTMKNASSGMLRRVALVRTEVSDKHIASIIRVTRIGELGLTSGVTNNRSTLRRNTRASQRNIPEDGILQSHRRENLKS
jgi:hypothetical protein